MLCERQLRCLEVGSLEEDDWRRLEEPGELSVGSLVKEDWGRLEEPGELAVESLVSRRLEEPGELAGESLVKEDWRRLEEPGELAVVESCRMMDTGRQDFKENVCTYVRMQVVGEQYTHTERHISVGGVIDI